MEALYDPQGYMYPIGAADQGMMNPVDPSNPESAAAMGVYCPRLDPFLCDLGSGRPEGGVTTLHSDTQQELLWVGTTTGHVTSYFSSYAQKYSSFHTHAQDEPIKAIESIQAGVLVLCRDYMRGSQRGGLTLFHYNTDEVKYMETMHVTHRNSLLLGGHQSSLLELDLSTLQISNQIETGTEDVVLIRSSELSQYALGHLGGGISFLDPRSSSAIVHTLAAHTGALSDFYLQGNLLVSCGFSTNQEGELQPESQVKVYDLRNFRFLQPYHLDFEPSFIRLCPGYLNKVLVASQSGNFQIIDPSGLVIPEAMFIHSVPLDEGASVTTVDISSTSQLIAFGDNVGAVHLWSDSNVATFNEFSNPTEFGARANTDYHIEFDDPITPYSIIPLPIPTGPNPSLASDWPPELTEYKVRKPVQIAPEILNNIIYQDFIGYAPNLGTKHRNQVPYHPSEYLSSGYLYCDKEAEVSVNSVLAPVPESTASLVPDAYRKSAEVTISNLLSEDFDPAPHNLSTFTALLHQSVNDYCNPLLQTLFFIEPLRDAIKHHLCHREPCMACQLSILFQILAESNRGEVYQTVDFVRSFRSSAEASALGLVLSEFDDKLNVKEGGFGKLIQNFNRFILQQVYQDLQRKETAKEGSEGVDLAVAKLVETLFSHMTDQTSTCKCGNITHRELSNFILPITYPQLCVDRTLKFCPFPEVVIQSLATQVSTQAWCPSCQRYQPTTQCRRVTRLPPYLPINLQIEKMSDVAFWKTQQKLRGLSRSSPVDAEQLIFTEKDSDTKMCRYGNNCSRRDCKFRHEKDDDIQEKVATLVTGITDEPWAPLKFRICIDEEGNMSAVDLDITPLGEKHREAEDSCQVFEYELMTSVISVHSDAMGHLVARIKVNQKLPNSPWFLFKDISILPIDPSTANKFDLRWCTPCILYYKLIGHDSSPLFRDLSKSLEAYPASTNGVDSISPAIMSFGEECLLAEGAIISQFSTFTPLERSELPHLSSVGLSLQFNMAHEEETELRADGSTETTQRCQYITVSHVVCVRGEGPKAFTTFMDDYIATPEQVTDYWNKLREDGVQSPSSNHLTTLKSVLAKLRRLEASGTLVGYGLTQDLKLLNLPLKKSSIVDVALLFRLPRQKVVPLRFLCFYFLGGVIPHESAPVVSLRLYKRYMEATNNGRTMQGFKTMLQEMYDAGRDSNFMVPSSGENNNTRR